MPNLTGRYFHAIDAKSRLTIPARLRDAINPREEGYGFVATRKFDDVLCLYTPRTYDQIAPQFDATAQTDPDVRDYERVTYGLAEDLELDRMGRVLIPEHLAKECGLEKEVVVVGVRNRIEVWPRDKWEAHIEKKTAEQDELAKRALAYEKKSPAPEPEDSA